MAWDDGGLDRGRHWCREVGGGECTDSLRLGADLETKAPPFWPRTAQG